MTVINRKSNCLIFAMLLYRRRRSDYGWFQHFLVRAGHHVVSYTPIAPRRNREKRMQMQALQERYDAQPIFPEPEQNERYSQ